MKVPIVMSHNILVLSMFADNYIRFHHCFKKSVDQYDVLFSYICYLFIVFISIMYMSLYMYVCTV